MEKKITKRKQTSEKHQETPQRDSQRLKIDGEQTELVKGEKKKKKNAQYNPHSFRKKPQKPFATVYCK